MPPDRSYTFYLSGIFPPSQRPRADSEHCGGIADGIHKNTERFRK
ncbi:MAG: hypothetical protein ACP6IY_22220 [Promethearchaeia archaeon]